MLRGTQPGSSRGWIRNPKPRPHRTSCWAEFRRSLTASREQAKKSGTKKLQEEEIKKNLRKDERKRLQNEKMTCEACTTVDGEMEGKDAFWSFISVLCPHSA